ncbi:MAG: sulfatase-like hydrolase/transferase [Firmicutes bacterium]|nr:sulfatase-like hydrolase/transferase [Bacillota bacterium]
MRYVFFFPDEMRASALSVYGNPVAITPNYDRLAAEGTVFENNYTAHPVCVASRCSLMTGWYPHVAGFRTLRYFLHPYHPNFLRYIHNAGYETHVYGKNHVFDKDTYFECVDKYLYVDFQNRQGQKYEGNVPMAKLVSKNTTNINGPANAAAMFNVKDYTMLLDPLDDSEVESINDTRCVGAAIDAIRGWKEGDKPLFIFLPTFYPHAPYSITKHFTDMYDPEKMPDVLPPDLEKKPQLQALIRHYREMGDTDPMVYKKVYATYLAMVSYSDMLLGRVLDALDETGLAKDTTVIASSDHGDWAGDWGLIEKWPSGMDDDLTKVPLIVRRPGCPAGHRVKELTQTFDVFPTICDWENIPIEHDQFGVSLAEQVAGAAGDPERVVYCEGGYDEREPHCFEGTPKFSFFMVPRSIYYPKMIQQQEAPKSVCRTVMMRTPKYKLNVRTDGDNELYDMVNDPTELNNIYDDPAMKETVAELKSQMLTWLIGTSDTVPREDHI